VQTVEGGMVFSILYKHFIG